MLIVHLHRCTRVIRNHANLKKNIFVQIKDSTYCGPKEYRNSIACTLDLSKNDKNYLFNFVPMFMKLFYDLSYDMP